MESKKFLIFRIILIVLCIISLGAIEYYQRTESKKEEIVVKKEKEIINEDTIIDMAKVYVSNHQDYFSEIIKEKDFEYRLNTDLLVKSKLINNNDNYKGYVKIVNDEYTFVRSNNMLLDKINDKDYVSGINNEKNAYDIKYIYKGNDPKNYIRYENKLYRIIGITNSDDLKVIETSNSTEEKWGLSGDINYLKTEDGYEKNNKGIFYVGYVRSETNNIDLIMKNEKRNNNYTVVTPKLYAEYSYVNISDIINAADECSYYKITDISIDTCSSYLVNMLKGTYTSTAAENKMVFKVDDQGKIIIDKLDKNINVKKVKYISLLNEYKSGNGTLSSPYEIK